MRFPFETIDSVDDYRSAAWIMIVQAFVHGTSRESELGIDADAVRESFIEGTALTPEERSNYADEPATALTDAKQSLYGQMREVLRSDEKLLQDDYPFTLSFDPQAKLVIKETVGAAGLAYIWRAAFALVSVKVLQLPKQEKNDFDTQSEKLFELFATLALGGRASGPVWYLGRHRSVQKLLRSLEELCKTLGSGEVQEVGKLRAYVKNSNDGGVDAISLYAPNGTIESGTSAYLLSATVQASNRASKVIGDREKKRFRKLFRSEPLIAMHGALAIPFEQDERDREYCADSDSIYMDMDSIYRFIRRISAENLRQAWSRHIILSVRCRINHLARSAI